MGEKKRHNKHKLNDLANLGFDDDNDEHKGDEEVYDMDLHLFNNSLLSDLSKYIMQKGQMSEAPTYCLRCGFNQNNQITSMIQHRMYNVEHGFSRDVNRIFNGRYSTW